MTTIDLSNDYETARKAALAGDLEREKEQAKHSEHYEDRRESFSDLTHWNSFICIDSKGVIWGRGEAGEAVLEAGWQSKSYYEDRGRGKPRLRLVRCAILLTRICDELGGGPVSYEIIDGVAYPAGMTPADWANYRFVPQAKYGRSRLGSPLARGKWVWVGRTLP